MNKIHIRRCNSQVEWDKVKYFRQKYFFEPNDIEDPYQWTFTHPLHEHFVLYDGIKIIGYAHIQLWEGLRAAIRIIVVEEGERNKGFGSEFLRLCEDSLKSHGYKTVHIESSPAALNFYKKNFYVELPFNDPDGYESSPEDTALGKKL